VGAKAGAGIHHPRFGYFLKARADKLGVDCTVRVLDDRPLAVEIQRVMAQADFVKRKLVIKP
jgi:hypothetical protein